MALFVRSVENVRTEPAAVVSSWRTAFQFSSHTCSSVTAPLIRMIIHLPTGFENQSFVS